MNKKTKNLDKNHLSNRKQKITTNKNHRDALKLIIKAGVHLGHQELHPKIKAYLSGNRKNRKILDLKQTFKFLYYSKILVDEVYKKGGTILFVCTRPGISQIIQGILPKNNRILFINHKWVGGTLTNWDEIIKQTFDMKINNKLPFLKKSKAKRFGNLFNPFLTLFSVPEEKQNKENLENTLKIQAPSLVVLFHGSDQIIPLREAKKTHTPVISIVDSDANPEDIFYPIPGNDDSIRSQYLQARTLFHGIPSLKKLK